MPVLGYFLVKSLVISFVYLTNHLTNIRTKLYTFGISPVESQHNNIKITTKRCSNVIVLLYTAETEK